MVGSSTCQWPNASGHLLHTGPVKPQAPAQKTRSMRQKALLLQLLRDRPVRRHEMKYRTAAAVGRPETGILHVVVHFFGHYDVICLLRRPAFGCAAKKEVPQPPFWSVGFGQRNCRRLGFDGVGGGSVERGGLRGDSERGKRSSGFSSEIWGNVWDFVVSSSSVLRIIIKLVVAAMASRLFYQRCFKWIFVNVVLVSRRQLWRSRGW